MFLTLIGWNHVHYNDDNYPAFKWLSHTPTIHIIPWRYLFKENLRFNHHKLHYYYFVYYNYSFSPLFTCASIHYAELSLAKIVQEKLFLAIRHTCFECHSKNTLVIQTELLHTILEWLRKHMVCANNELVLLI